MKNVFIAGILGTALLIGPSLGHAESWILNTMDVPNKNLASNYYDGDSVRVHEKALKWTEKFVLTDFGSTKYSKHLSQYPACKSNIEKLGNVTYHQLDFEIKGGKFRTVAKRNYTKDNKLVCTDRDTGKDLDKNWHEVEYKSAMYERYYNLATKYKIGDL
jgi:hypothetical protein